MKFIARTIVLFFIAVQVGSAQSLNIFQLGDFLTERGNVIENCEIGYRTFGTLNRDSSNVILYPSWFGGTSAMISNNVGPGRIVDDSQFFIIAVDALGNGISSSPSTSITQTREDFPEITIGDMVDAQYRLLTEKFGFRRIHGAVGGSMGGMQIFEWLVRYPDFIQRAVPYVATPQLSTYDLLVFNLRKEIIETGLRYGINAREIMNLLNIHDEVHANTPDYIHEIRSRDEFPAYLNSFDRDPPSVFTVDNYLTQLNAILGHDVARNAGGSLERAAQRVRASVLIIVSETDILIHPAPSIEFARLINAGLTVLQNDCGHAAVRCEMETVSQLIHAFFSM